MIHQRLAIIIVSRAQLIRHVCAREITSDTNYNPSLRKLGARPARYCSGSAGLPRRLFDSDPLYQPTDSEKRILYKYRHRYKNDPR